MRTIITGFVLLAILSGCSSTKTYYFYAMLDSGDAKTQKNYSGIFCDQRDSLNIYYSFSGENITLKLNVENNSSYLISMNWNNSFLQTNDMMPKMYINIHRKDNTLDISAIGGFSTKEYLLLQDASFNFRQINKREATTQYKNLYGLDIKTKSLEFNSNNTPLFLSSKVYLKPEDHSPIAFTNNFYLSSLNRINKSDYKKLKKRANLRGDIFCIQYHRDRNNKFANSLFSALIDVSYMILDNKLNEGLDINN